jgi:phospholipid/cholesterol/gamma-HCH transport system substrate-binding protein
LRGTSAIGRIAALIALAIAVVAVVMLLGGGGGEEYEVTAEFENAGQLVNGNEVVVGGTPVGTVSEIELGPDGQALVSFTVQEEFAPLRRGTTATVRSPSLSQIAGRQVQLTLPPSSAGGEEIDSGEHLSQSETVSAVDLDQIFNTLSPKTIRDFKHVIQGFEISYQGVEREANKGVRYLNPFLSTSRQVLGELSADQRALENLIVDAAKLSGAVAERAPDVSALVGNLNQMMGALGARRAELAESIAKLPAFMRDANTTFVNLRAALDDVDPLVDASKPVAVRLRPFLGLLRAAAEDAVPTIRDLDAILKRPGADNDLVELTLAQPKLTRRALGQGSPDCGADPAEDYEDAADQDFTQGAFGESVCALRNSLPQLSFFRAYSPELVGWFDGFSHSGVIDANGGAARVEAIFNTFTVSDTTGLPIIGSPLTSLAENLGSVTTGALRKCPGANERPLGAADPADDSVPFTDGGALTDGTPGDCDPSIVQQGP